MPQGIDQFPERLRKARTSRSYTQAQLAERCGVSSQQIWRWEAGKSVPELDNAIEISRVLSVSLDWLIGKDSANTLIDGGEITAEERTLLNAARGNDHTHAIRLLAEILDRYSGRSRFVAT